MFVSRRTLLRAAIAAAAAPALPEFLTAAPATAASSTTAQGTAAQAVMTQAAPSTTAQTAVKAFVTDYQTNVTANLTVETNAAVRILSGMQRLWHTGTTWDSGTVLDPAVLRANMRYVVRVTGKRTPEQAARAFIQDRQHQSYAVISALGPYAAAYKEKALAVTSITTAPESTPPTTISDAVPADAPAGSAIGAGSPTSAMGQIVSLVNTVRGPFASGNPSKAAYQYPRPWRMDEDSEVVDTGVLDALGYPVYDSAVSVVPQLLRQRGLAPADDGGFPSGHTNAFHLAALAFAYAVPERFQELVTAAFDLSDTRIIAGMHSPADVIGGRILATALAAAALNDPANAILKAEARDQIKTTLLPAALSNASPTSGHGSASPTSGQGNASPTSGQGNAADPYADRAANKRLVAAKLTYGLPRRHATTPMTVPQGAEVLLETRFAYLTADQRREVLRTTALPAGYPLLDGPENWGRLNLFAAADGYGAFDHDVDLHLDATSDTWHNDITGRSALTKSGTGTLTLAGANTYRGGTTLKAGTLIAAAPSALGTGEVTLAGGTLHVTEALRLRGHYRQRSGVLTLPAETRALTIAGEASLAGTLEVTGRSTRPQTLLTAHRITGRFAQVTATDPAYRAEVAYTRTTVTVRLHKR
ncbi:phosphatase PAP2 family protein [Winogradskya humida]|uniref:Phosphoesterase n=1 Tax=Winogradskya humida TaxID=113566 RepID=A0ABQ3ZVD1_9ACTN|nr:phosphatase PAP2 family protein [Actinoplanes humidus]GIE22529.1 phosphoesterase [Actinoplanes humidus]